MQEEANAATTARSNLHQKGRELRASTIEYTSPSAIDRMQRAGINSNNRTTAGKKDLMALRRQISSTSDISQPQSGLPLTNLLFNCMCFEELQIFFLIEAPSFIIMLSVFM